MWTTTCSRQTVVLWLVCLDVWEILRYVLVLQDVILTVQIHILSVCVALVTWRTILLFYLRVWSVESPWSVSHKNGHCIVDDIVSSRCIYISVLLLMSNYAYISFQFKAYINMCCLDETFCTFWHVNRVKRVIFSWDMSVIFKINPRKVSTY